MTYLSWLTEQVQQWGYYALFLFTCLETSAFLGLIIPGETVVVLAGILAGRGVLDLGDTIMIASAGAIAGDSVGYFIGHRFGYDLRRRHRRRMFIKKQHLEQTEAFFHRYGGKTVFLGRFFGWLRAFAPLVAGIAKMPYWRFLFFHVYGGILWAIVFSLLGYVTGNSWGLIKGFVGQAGVAGGVVGVVTVIAYFVVQRRRQLVRCEMGRLDRNLSARLPAAWAFVKGCFRRHSSFGLGLTVALALLAGAALILAVIVEDVVHQETLYRLDFTIRQFVERLVGAPTTQFLVASVHWAAEYLFVVPVLGAAIFLIRIQKPWLLATLFVAVGAGQGVLAGLEHVFAATGPHGASRLPDVSSNFPSSHAYNAMLIYGFVIYLAWTAVKNEVLRFLLYGVACFVILLVGVGETYLNVHWLTDVLAGYVTGLAWLVLSVVLVKSMRELHR